MATATRKKTGKPEGSAAPYDVERIRTDFPILYREIYGKPLVYLDNGASAQKPLSVIEAMDHAYRFEYANVHRGLHYLSNTATQRFEEARETVRRFLNAPSSDQIIFTRNATEAINLVASWFGAHGDRGGRRDRPVGHGASLEHRALAVRVRAAAARCSR